MDIVLKGVTIIDPSSPFHQQTTDIFVQNGFIVEIGTISNTSGKVVTIDSLHVAPGFTDVFSHFCDPGFEFRETLDSGALSATYGGYTDVLVLPNTNPVADHKSGIDYIIQKSKVLPVNLHPIAAITKNTEGKELSEMYDMHQSGAIAFSDGLCSIQSPGILVKALQYLKAIDQVLIQLPDDQAFSPQGLMNEGIISTRLGLPGIPSIAEDLMVRRDIELANYTESKVHLTGLSTANSIELVRQAKQKGINITCSVTPYHLFFTDDDVTGYDTNLKLSPPLRTKEDRESLLAALLDGTIDCIASHHIPHHVDHKVVEFEYAKNGMIGLETCFAAVRSAVPHLPLDRLIELFTSSPRKIFGLPLSSINVNQPASLSLILPNEEWTPLSFYSKSKNSAFVGKKLKGKPLGIIHKDGLFLRP